MDLKVIWFWLRMELITHLTIHENKEKYNQSSLCTTAPESASESNAHSCPEKASKRVHRYEICFMLRQGKIFTKHV